MYQSRRPITKRGLRKWAEKNNESLCEFIVREDWEAIDHLKEKTRPKLAVMNH